MERENNKYNKINNVMIKKNKKSATHPHRDEREREKQSNKHNQQQRKHTKSYDILIKEQGEISFFHFVAESERESQPNFKKIIQFKFRPNS